MNERVSGKKFLCLPGRFKSLHLPFAPSGRSMRVFRAIVQVPALSMFNLGKQLAPGHAIASKFIGHDHARDILKSLQQSSKEAFGGFRIPPWLNEDVKRDTVLIHRSPKIVLHSLDTDEHLVKMPLVAGPRTAAAQTVGKGLAAEPTHRAGGLGSPPKPGGVDILPSKVRHKWCAIPAHTR